MDQPKGSDLMQLRGILETLGESVVPGTVELKQVIDVRQGLNLLRSSGEVGRIQGLAHKVETVLDTGKGATKSLHVC